MTITTNFTEAGEEFRLVNFLTKFLGQSAEESPYGISGVKGKERMPFMIPRCEEPKKNRQAPERSIKNNSFFA